MRRGSLLSLLAVAVALVLAGCQSKVEIDTKVNRDGSGLVTVGVGLDDQALTHLGDPSVEVLLDDARAAGWTIGPPVKEADGLTWLRGTKPFTDSDDLNKLYAEIQPGMFGHYTFTRNESDADTTYQLTGTVDLSKGIDQFTDPEVAGQLNGDGFGGQIQLAEHEGGKPIADLVTFEVRATVADGSTKAFHPTLKDTAAVPIDVSTSEPKPPSTLQSIGLYSVIAIGAGVVILMLYGARRAFSSQHS